MAAGNFQSVRSHLSQAIAIARTAGVPLAAWRVYATAARFHENSGEPQKAAKYRCRSDQIVRSLTNSLEPNDPLRSVEFLAGAGRRINL